MIDPTSLSTNQSPTEGDTPSKPNLPTPQVGGMSLSDIPVFTRSGSVKRSTDEEPTAVSSSEPPSYVEEVVEGKFEYEFTNLWDGCLYSVYLYDTVDLSACERVVNRPVKAEEITYSATGNGFITDGEFKYTFKKDPYKRLAASVPQVSYESKLRRRTSIKVRTADDILSELL